MKLPSEAEIETLKREASAKGCEVHLLPYNAFDFAVVVRTMTAREWAKWCDLNRRNAIDSNDAALVDFVVWPSPAEVDSYKARMPALSTNVTKELMELAGQIDPDPERTILDASTDAAVLERAMLPREKAADLIAQYNHPRQLSILRFPSLDMDREGAGIAMVVRTPAAAVFRARLAAYHAAIADCEGVWDQAVNATRDLVVWSSSPLDDVFARWPGVVSGDLINQFAKLGGSGAKAQRRRL